MSASEGQAAASSAASAEPAYRLVAKDRGALIDELDVSGERFQIGRVFQGDGLKLIRLAFAAGQVMREHSTNAPLVVQVIEGTLKFRVAGDELTLEAGAVLHVRPHEVHELEAVTDTHVLLTLAAG